MLRLLSIATALLVLVACDDGDPPPGEDAGGGDTDAGMLTCDAPETSCPPTLPFEGAPCDLADNCEYDPQEGEHWTYSCTDGVWIGTVECMLLGGGCVPPLVETCETPVRDHGAGTVEIGPVSDGAFRPFMDGEEADVTIGGQGSPMIQFRIRTVDDAPACTEMVTTLRTPVADDVVGRTRLRIRCGESLGVFTVMPVVVDCPPGPTTQFELEVELTGIGSTTATLTVDSMVFCTALPG